MSNQTVSAYWDTTIDILEDQIEQARGVPPWGIAVIVLCALSFVSILVVCGFSCGLLYQYRLQQQEQHKRLIIADAAVSHMELQLQDNVEPPPRPKISSKLKGKQRISQSDAQ